MALSPFAHPASPEQALDCKSKLYLIDLNMRGHTYVSLFREIDHEGRRDRKRDGQTRKEEQKERWMSGGLATDGQQRVLSKERMEKMERKMDGQLNARRESGNSWVMASKGPVICRSRCHGCCGPG